MTALLSLAFLACTPTSIDTSGEEDTDLPADDDAGEDEVDEPSIEDWEGDWVGGFQIDGFGDNWFDGCEGDLELDVDDDGEVDGDGTCDYGGRDYEVDFSGEINAEGELEGTLTIGFAYAGDVDCELTGAAEGEDLEGEFEGLYYYESWGTEYEYDVTGSIELERD